MTCKDCLYLTVCDYDANKYNFRLPENADKCSFFKDRSKFVELPSVSVPIKIYLSDDVDNTFVLRNYCFDCNQNNFYMIIQCIETQEFLMPPLCRYSQGGSA